MALKHDTLDSLLLDALSPEREGSPPALATERARFLLLRGRPPKKRGVEESIALLGCVASLVELAAVLLLLTVFPPMSPPVLAILGFSLFQAVCLLTCSIGSRVAMRRLQRAA